jgi:AraC family transcriptional regulator, ethanolamine operon transcriptional activator
MDSLPSSSVLTTFHCSDPEAVTGNLSGTKRRLLPLAGAFRFFQAEMRLADLRLAIVKRPPCASEGYLHPREIGIAWPLDDSPGLKLDGRPLDQPSLVTHGLTVPHRISQPGELTISAVFVPEANGDRGWPERATTARVDAVRAESLAQLRTTVRDVVRLAARDPGRFSSESVISGMRQSVLGGIDHAFLTAPSAAAPGLAIGNHVRVCRRADEFVRRHTNDVPSSAEVAAAAGVTIRTLHNAMVAVHGMSLQRFMILNRLWTVRAALLRANAGDLVKTIAFDHGFWHLGRFSTAYRLFFGETPSQTLGRAERGSA